MLNTIVVMRKSTPCVIRRINVNTLDLTSELLFECFQCQEVIAKDESVIENIVVGDTMRGVIRLFWFFQQDTWFQLRPIFLANPG
jgi:hypothetical protein